MVIQAQKSSGLMYGGSDHMHAYGSNNLHLNPPHHHQPKPHQHQESMHRHPSISNITPAPINHQRTEIDHCIDQHSERLRMALREQTRQHASLLMKRYEPKIQSLMRRKDDEILAAANLNVELQDCARRLEMEQQTLQRAAEEYEATAAYLHGTIQRLRESAAARAEEDAESRCCGETRERETRKRVCRCCNSRNSCVIMLPCTHLCSCRECDAFLDFCPVCNLAKTGSLEALF